MAFRATEYVTKSVPVSWVKLGPQVRREFSEESLRELGASMLAQGQLHPIGVLADGTLLWGERRVRAAALVGIATLEARVYEVAPTEVERILVQIAENKHESLAPYELGAAIERVAELCPEWTNLQLAEAFALDPSAMTRLRAAFRAPVVREALQAGTVGVATAYAISKLPASEQATALRQVEAGATRDEIERKRRSASAENVKVSRVKIAIKNVTAVLVGRELGMAQIVDALAEMLREAKRAAATYDVKTWVRMMADKAAEA